MALIVQLAEWQGTLRVNKHGPLQEAAAVMRLPVVAVPLLTAGVDAALAHLSSSACDGAQGKPTQPRADGENTQPNCYGDRDGNSSGERCIAHGVINLSHSKHGEFLGSARILSDSLFSQTADHSTDHVCFL